MVCFRTDFHGLSETGSTGWKEHELLERELVASMRTAINNIEGRAGKHIGRLDASKLGQVLVHGNALLGGASLDDCDRDTEDSVSTVLALVGGTVLFDQEIVDLLLLSNLEARGDQRRAEDVVDVCNSLGNTCSKQALTNVVGESRISSTYPFQHSWPCHHHEARGPRGCRWMHRRVQRHGSGLSNDKLNLIYT